jgi:hypothetical protein
MKDQKLWPLSGTIPETAEKIQRSYQGGVRVRVLNPWFSTPPSVSSSFSNHLYDLGKMASRDPATVPRIQRFPRRYPTKFPLGAARTGVDAAGAGSRIMTSLHSTWSCRRGEAAFEHILAVRNAKGTWRPPERCWPHRPDRAGADWAANERDAGGRKKPSRSARSAPLVVRGGAPVLSWTPPRLEPATDDTLMRLLELYRCTDVPMVRGLEERIGLSASIT